MKKILCLFVCFAALAVGAAFGLDLPDALKLDGLSVDGKIQTGFRVEGGTHDAGSGNGYTTDPDTGITSQTGVDSGAVNPVARAYSDDIGDGTAFRTDLNVVYQKENVGIKTRFRFQPRRNRDDNFDSPFTTAALTINKGFIWANVLPKTVKVSAGRGLDEAWKLFYADFDNKGTGTNTAFDGKDGLKVEVTPIEGLNVGAFYGMANLFRDAYSDGDQNTTAGDRRLVVGATYDNPRFAVMFSVYHNFADADYDLYTTTANYYVMPAANPMNAVDNALPQTTNLLVGAQLKATDSLPLQLDLSVLATNLGSRTLKKAYFDGNDNPQLYNKGDYNPFWGLQPKIQATYGFNDKLSAALELTGIQIGDWYYYAEGGKDKAEDSGLGHFFPITINVTPAYAINDDIAASAQLSFKIHAGGSDQFGFGFKPKVEFSLGDDASFVVSDELVFWTQSKLTKDDPGDFGTKHRGVQNILNNNGVAGTANTLQFDFVWSF